MNETRAPLFSALAIVVIALAFFLSFNTQTVVTGAVLVQEEGGFIAGTPHTTLDCIGGTLTCANVDGTAFSLTVGDEFVDLVDTPASYVGEGLDLVRVNIGETALEFVAPAVVLAHNILSPTHSDAATVAVARGALIYGDATPEWDRLVVGGADTFLRTDGTDVAWSAITLGTNTTGNYVTSLVAGTAIDVGAAGEGATPTVAWDSTEVNATTWGDGTQASNVWDFNLTAGDPSITFGNATIGLSTNLDLNSNTITKVGNAGSQLLANAWTMTSANTQILSLTTTGAAASTYINSTIPAAGTGVAYLRFIQGAGSGDADNQKYTIYYEGNLGLFRLQSESVGPVSTAGVIIEIADDTNDVKFAGGISVDGLAAPTSGIALTGDLAFSAAGTVSTGAGNLVLNPAANVELSGKMIFGLATIRSKVNTDFWIGGNHDDAEAIAREVQIYTLDTAGDTVVKVAAAIPTTSPTTPFWAQRADVTTPVATGTWPLPASFLTFKWNTANDEVSVYVNDGGTIRTVVIGTVQ